MPMYTVEHSYPLTAEQKNQLAEALTKIHTEKFTVPRFFVNINIKDISSEWTYGAGMRNKANRISGQIRWGPSRTDEMLYEIIEEIHAAWASIVGTKGDQGLRAVFIHGSIVASAEKGFLSPKAGADVGYLKKNYAAFKQRADEGDKEFQSLMKEVENREAFRGVVDEAAVFNRTS
ncbi:hypothetical protein NA57DRAFT_48587 [Rhizodiscina lignyota]|uniref:Tautomerase cis-CaaD-like domain-containing protein n=1 Tax=Rhizodiscina lignyota TaxID=1504668 RepID=A0A9P4I1I0_9PEZI|nr:hypothetical protein NA57DRAFT_48587 [Rhizodiscina lignyota]